MITKDDFRLIDTTNLKHGLLEEGDIIKEGDEYYNPHEERWLTVTDGEQEDDGTYPDRCIGYPFDPEESRPIRRKL